VVLIEKGREIVQGNRPMILIIFEAGKIMGAGYRIKQENTTPEGEKVLGKPD
jgi:hypothetical protein